MPIQCFRCVTSCDLSQAQIAQKKSLHLNRHIISKILNWINNRWPIKAVIRWGLDEVMPGGASYVYVFGSCVLLREADYPGKSLRNVHDDGTYETDGRLSPAGQIQSLGRISPYSKI